MDSSNNEYITNFNATTKTYTIVIPHDVTTLNVRAVSNSDAATINDGTNTYNGTINNIGLLLLYHYCLSLHLLHYFQ